MKQFLTYIVSGIIIAASILPVWGAQKSQLDNAVPVTLPEYAGAPRVTPVADGIFGVQTGWKWSFYSIGGSRIFSEVALKAPHGDPLFDNGALVMEDTQSNPRQSHYVILYSNGTKKDLPDNWSKVTNFVDGVALVKEFDARYKPSIFYINTKGEKIWPHLTVSSGRSMDATRPLRDNRRAFQKGELWGYMDGDGRVVIEPQFVVARDFSENHAAVVIKRDGKHFMGFIAQNGNFSFPATIPNYGYENYKVGNLHSGLIRIVEDDGISYYDITGAKLRTYPESKGTEFVDGFAMVNIPKPQDWLYAVLIDTDFNIVTELDDSKGVYGIDNYHPVFSAQGLAPKQFHREVMNPRGTSVIAERDPKVDKEGAFDDMNTHYYPFSDDGYAFAELVVDKKKYYGIVDSAGNCVILFDREAVPSKR